MSAAMNNEMAQSHYDMALQMAADSDAPAAEKAAMLSDIGSGIQRRANTREQLDYAIALQQEALTLVADNSSDQLLCARIALQLGFTRQLASDDVRDLQKVVAELEGAYDVLRSQGDKGEVTELHINLGLAYQSLAAQGRADPRKALDAYHAALSGIDAVQQPAQFAIVQSNLALVMLSMCNGGDSDAMREALAVQAFEAGLSAVNAQDHPAEFAMLQNNLGNALQHAASGHPIANRLRAVEAYDAAIAVREELGSPTELAGTIANRAHCLCTIPDDPEQPARGNPNNLIAARSEYHRALILLSNAGDAEKSSLIREAIAELDEMLTTDPAAAVTDHG